MNQPEALHSESLDLAKRMVDLTTYMASQEFRANTTVEEAYAITEQLSLHSESLDLAKRMVDLTTYMASQEFRANTTVEEAYAITEQLHALASAHFHVLRRIELAERRMDFTQQ